MRVVVQRVKHSGCTVDSKLISSINKGFMLLIGFKNTDTLVELEKVLKKVSGLRIFEDENGKMNKSLKDVNGEILAISQFTLYADSKHGNRPSFVEAMKYKKANEYYDLFCDKLNRLGFVTKKGIFGADMKIDLINDGPVTIILDSDDL